MKTYTKRQRKPQLSMGAGYVVYDEYMNTGGGCYVLYMELMHEDGVVTIAADFESYSIYRCSLDDYLSEDMLHTEIYTNYDFIEYNDETEGYNVNIELEACGEDFPPYVYDYFAYLTYKHILGDII